jgi:hypothetical protein
MKGRFKQDGQDKQDKEEVQNDECRVMNEKTGASDFYSSLCIPHSSFL